MNTQIYEEATSWLIKHREAELSASEKLEFDAWLRASPQHMRAYLEMSALWEDVSALEPDWNPGPRQLIAQARAEGNIHPLGEVSRLSTEGPRIPAPFSTSDKSEPRARNHRDPSRTDLDSRGRQAATLTAFGIRRTAPRLRYFAVLAICLVAILGATVWYGLNRNTYATDIGEQRSIVLADGSTIELNSRSRVRIRYTNGERGVDLLEGQALFRVTHNTARPFVVHSDAANVRAVGTQFDVYRKQTGTVVTVVEGKVAVSGYREREPGPRQGEASPDTSTDTAEADLPGPTPAIPLVPVLRPQLSSKSGTSAIFVTAGEQLIVSAGRPSQAGDPAASAGPQHANVAAAIAWTHHTLVFDASRLADVAEEFNRYNTRELVIADPELADIRISGVFSSVDPALLLKFLHTQSELTIEETETEIRIKKR